MTSSAMHRKVYTHEKNIMLKPHNLRRYWWPVSYNNYSITTVKGHIHFYRNRRIQAIRTLNMYEKMEKGTQVCLRIRHV